MSRTRYLPLWLHRIFNGLFPAALLAGFATFWIDQPPGSWRHVVSVGMLWSSIPVGLVFAAMTRRFSIVEGLAGEIGYEEDESGDQKPSR
jgi:hypothetical protein